MNVLRKLAWAAVLASSGVTPAEDAPQPSPAAPAPAPTPAKPAAAPAQQPRPAHATEPVRPCADWPLDLDDDEFEGEGWTFWPLAKPRR
jgi:hypothetical protein